MKQTKHFQERVNQRKKGDVVVDVLFTHGRITEQKGNSYSLSLGESDQLQQLRREAQQEADAARHQMLLLRRERKQAAVKALPMDPELEAHQHAAKRMFKRKRRELKALRPAMLVCGSDKQGQTVLITIGSLFKETA